MKQKITFALLMGVVTTCIVSFTLVSINVGFVDNFLWIWLKSWVIAYITVIPCIMIISPRVQLLVDYFFEKKQN